MKSLYQIIPGCNREGSYITPGAKKVKAICTLLGEANNITPIIRDVAKDIGYDLNELRPKGLKKFFRPLTDLFMPNDVVDRRNKAIRYINEYERLYKDGGPQALKNGIAVG